jgi:hypothetical protein
LTSLSNLFADFSPNKPHNVRQILRKGHINLDVKSAVSLMLISEPLIYDGCEWGKGSTKGSKEKKDEDLSTTNAAPKQTGTVICVISVLLTPN